MQRATRTSRDTPLPEPLRAKLREIVAKHGETSVAAKLPCARQTLARGLAGLPLNHAMAEFMAAGVERIASGEVQP